MLLLRIHPPCDFETRSLTGLQVAKKGKADWLASPKAPQGWDYSTHLSDYPEWVLEIEFQSSCFQGKYLTISPALERPHLYGLFPESPSDIEDVPLSQRLWDHQVCVCIHTPQNYRINL